MPKVYVASSLLNANRATEIMNQFRAAGATITHDWTTHGMITDEAELGRHGQMEFHGAVNCDLFFFLHPGRTGAHVELGAALASTNNPTIVMLFEGEAPETKTFYHLECVNRFYDAQEAMQFSLEKLGLADTK